jgi:hypothetical protein
VSILLAAAFVSYRAVLGVGAVAVVMTIATLAGLHATTAESLPTVLFIITTSSLAAVVTKHHDALDVLRQAAWQQQNAELRAMRDKLEQRVDERTEALLAAEKMAPASRTRWLRRSRPCCRRSTISKI